MMPTMLLPRGWNDNDQEESCCGASPNSVPTKGSSTLSVAEAAGTSCSPCADDSSCCCEEDGSSGSSSSSNNTTTTSWFLRNWVVDTSTTFCHEPYCCCCGHFGSYNNNNNNSNNINRAAAADNNNNNNKSNNDSFFVQQAWKLVFCFCGLQASYLIWGYMQELIMTTQFDPTARVPDGKFPSATFCVFSNRFLAVLVAAAVVQIKKKQQHQQHRQSATTTSGGSAAAPVSSPPPLWAYTPCAVSNTISSWSQYRCLKYVSFPVQTVFKSSKTIPVMILGKLLQGTGYPLSQYIEAIIIAGGVATFSMSIEESSSDNNDEITTELLGLVLLLLYVSSDSFTSQWQDTVYTQYGRSNVDPYQMMLGVNLSAICITAAGLVLTGEVPVVWEFCQQNPTAAQYNTVSAVTSATGQIFIFYTIKEFGPIVYTVIMTTRQMFSICISAAVFGHSISPKAAAAALLVFAVIFSQIRRKYYAAVTAAAVRQHQQRSKLRSSDITTKQSSMVHDTN